MAKINLRDLYPEYELDCIVDVGDDDLDSFIAALTKEVADVYVEYQRSENAYQRRTYYHNAHYSLNVGDGIENSAVYHSPSPEELFIERLTREHLHVALTALPQPQRRRVEAHFIYGSCVTDIADAEGTVKSSVCESIQRGLHNMKNNLKIFD